MFRPPFGEVLCGEAENWTVAEPVPDWLPVMESHEDWLCADQGQPACVVRFTLPAPPVNGKVALEDERE